MYDKKLVQNKQDIVDFIKKAEKETEVDINWTDELLPDRYPTVMVLVVHNPKFQQFATVYWQHVYPEDFNT